MRIFEELLPVRKEILRRFEDARRLIPFPENKGIF